MKKQFKNLSLGLAFISLLTVGSSSLLMAAKPIKEEKIDPRNPNAIKDTVVEDPATAIEDSSTSTTADDPETSIIVEDSAAAIEDSSTSTADDPETSTIVEDSATAIEDSSTSTTADDPETATIVEDPSTIITISPNIFLMDSAGINGLKVKCGELEMMSVLGGGIECSSVPISAYLGEFKIGEVSQLPTDGLIFTQDLLNVTRGAIAHSEVTKISMILQSLDEDAEPLNGIALSSKSLDLLYSHLNASSNLESLSIEDIDFIINEIIASRLAEDSSSKLKAVDFNTAQSNLATSVAKLPALTYEERTN